MDPILSALLHDLASDGEHASLNILLGIVPSATGVCHVNGKHESAGDTANKHPSESLRAKQESNEERGDNSENARNDHLVDGSLRRDGNTLLVLRSRGGVREQVERVDL